MLVTVVTLFFIFWTPSTAWTLVEVFWLKHVDVETEWIRSIRSWVRVWAFINGCVNVIIYTICSRYAMLQIK